MSWKFTATIRPLRTLYLVGLCVLAWFTAGWHGLGLVFLAGCDIEIGGP